LSASEANPRAQLEQLQSELSSRRSIVHFAHSAVSLLVAMIFAGAAAKYFYDQFVLVREEHVLIGALFAGASAILLVYAAVRFFVGRKWLKHEAARYQTMMDLRATLKLDDPSALLPR
jgi:hypothetical protein